MAHASEKAPRLIKKVPIQGTYKFLRWEHTETTYFPVYQQDYTEHYSDGTTHVVTEIKNGPERSKKVRL